tara:strand:+ start:817 stop:1137 length:321 start_codon:yes stop_codon:yes gene_type:complete
MKYLENIVTNVLETNPKARDDDHILAGAIWIRELGGSHIAKEMGLWEFMRLFMIHELANIESIIRCRRKVQELNKDLRGTKYEYRHNRQDDVKEQIKKWSGELFEL